MRDRGDGSYTATITSSSRLGAATITATDGSLSAHANLWQHGAAANITLALSPASISANGSSTSVATVTVRDAQGDPVAGEPVTLASTDSAERISAVSDRGTGTYAATITSSTVAHAVAITATDGSLSAHGTLTQT